MVARCLIAALALAACPLTRGSNAVPFTVPYSAETVTDLHERLLSSRHPHNLADVAGTDYRSYGVSPLTMQKLVGHLLTNFSWEVQVSKLNEMPQYTMQIGEINVHYVHQLSSNTKAKPLMLVHGWPGSFWECSKILPLLTEPQLHGGRAEDAFHVICPSIPGYGYSSKPTREGFDQIECAKVFSSLMQELGYEEYYLQGGDWGSVITSLMASMSATQGHGTVLGLHLNMVPVAPPLFRGVGALLHLALSALLPSLYYTDLEWRDAKAAPMKALVQTGYFHEQATKPATLAYGLSDSPLGLLAWITEKFYEWSDCGGDVFSRFSADELLTNYMIYWSTNAAASSIRFYYEFFHGPNAVALKVFTSLNVKVPTGMAIFPVELFAPVRFWANYVYTDIVHWSHQSRGGHFAAMEEPLLLSQDIWRFVRTVNAESRKKHDL